MTGLGCHEKASNPGKSENEGIQRIPIAHTRGWLASSFSLTEKFAVQAGLDRGLPGGEIPRKRR